MSKKPKKDTFTLHPQLRFTLKLLPHINPTSLQQQKSPNKLRLRLLFFYTLNRQKWHIAAPKCGDRQNNATPPSCHSLTQRCCSNLIPGCRRDHLETRLLLVAGEDLKLYTKTCNPPSHQINSIQWKGRSGQSDESFLGCLKMTMSLWTRVQRLIPQSQSVAMAPVTLIGAALSQAAQGQVLLLLMWKSIKRQRVNKGQQINWLIILSTLFHGELAV